MTERSVDKKTDALKLALEALEDAKKNHGLVYVTELCAIREALAEQCVCGEPDTLGTHRTDGPCLAEQPAQQEPVAWRELCRRLYVELYWCDRQMMQTLDENGEPMWTQGKTVRDVLADAKAALDTPPPASKPWVGLTEEERKEIYRQAVYVDGAIRMTEAKLKEKNT